MMEMMNTIFFLNLLLRKESPGVSGNCSFLAVYTDDKDFTFRPDKRREMPVE
jgi:hypothetical protein